MKTKHTRGSKIHKISVPAENMNGKVDNDTEPCNHV